MTMKQRDEYVDVAKGIAMLMVVRIHTEVFGEIGAPYPVIAVPFFFFLSGFYDNTEKSINQWLPKAFNRLFLVGIFWVFISFAYVSLLHYLKDRTIPIDFTLEYPLIGGSVTWFLFALFYAKCLTCLIGKTKISRWIILPLLILLGGWLSQFNLPFLLDEGIAAVPFYYAGKVFYPCIKDNWKSIKWIALVGFVCILLMPMNWFPWVFVSYTKNPLLYALFFIMITSAFAFLLWISKLLENQKWLARFGTQTLGILVLHPLLLHTCAVILNRVMVKGSAPWVITFLCAYFIVCIICYYLSLWISKHWPVLLGVPRNR